jgi:hypothetical protein
VNADEPKYEGVLRGCSVFLSASVPVRPGFRRVSGAAVEVEEAVISFTRAVLREEGTVVFGAHPSISPLVASVASEYIVPRLRNTEPPDVETLSEQRRSGPGVVIYQSHAYNGYVPDKTWEMYRLGYADLIWCAAKDGEKFDPKNKRYQCPKSLEFMREQMFAKESPSAMVAVGGMEGVVEEGKLFLEHWLTRNAPFNSSPLYLIESTGGAAELLAATVPPEWPLKERHIVEREWQNETPAALSESAARTDPRARPFTPYPLIMQWLARKIAKVHWE